MLGLGGALLLALLVLVCLLCARLRGRSAQAAALELAVAGGKAGPLGTTSQMSDSFETWGPGALQLQAQQARGGTLARSGTLSQLPPHPMLKQVSLAGEGGGGGGIGGSGSEDGSATMSPAPPAPPARVSSGGATDEPSEFRPYAPPTERTSVDEDGRASADAASVGGNRAAATRRHRRRFQPSLGFRTVWYDAPRSAAGSGAAGSGGDGGSGSGGDGKAIFAKYEEVRQLGRGAFGAAVLMRHRRTGHTVVSKQVGIGALAQAELHKVENEVRILSSLQHAHIVTYHCSFQHADKLHIVMEYCARGSLDGAVAARRESHGAFALRTLLEWLRQLGGALQVRMPPPLRTPRSLPHTRDHPGDDAPSPRP